MFFIIIIIQTPVVNQGLIYIVFNHAILNVAGSGLKFVNNHYGLYPFQVILGTRFETFGLVTALS